MGMRLYDLEDGGKVVYRDDLIEQNTVLVGKLKFSFSNEAEAKLLYEAVTFFGSGTYVLPDNEAEARQALDDWLAHKIELEKWFRFRSERRSSDDRFIEKMMRAFWGMYHRYRLGLEDPPGSRKSPVHKVKVERSANEEPVPIVFGPIPRGQYIPEPTGSAPPNEQKATPAPVS